MRGKGEGEKNSAYEIGRGEDHDSEELFSGLTNYLWVATLVWGHSEREACTARRILRGKGESPETGKEQTQI